MSRNAPTPGQIVAELDRYIVGQGQAKRAVAIALRNRWRRQQVQGGLRGEIMPNNLIMIGPTGVGKTEISRRLAALAGAPFIKVEASKFTEVGYVGRDVESIVRDLVEQSVNMVRAEHGQQLEAEAERQAEERLLDLLGAPPASGQRVEAGKRKEQRQREQLRRQLRQGKLDDRQVEVRIGPERLPVVEVFAPSGGEEAQINFQEILSGVLAPVERQRQVELPEARRQFVHEEVNRLLDMDRVVGEAISRVEESGIVFLDELDKIAGDMARSGPDVSREGVQRDLLPLIEGCAVSTRYGVVRTDHILFIAAGAFHTARPADLIPELQGRFPIRVELDSLGEEEFVQILTRPESALIKQYTALLATEGVKISFDRSAIRQIARIACEVNLKTENIGARRLHTVMSALLDEVLFNAPGLEKKSLRIGRAYVRDKLQDILEDEDLSRYIL